MRRIGPTIFISTILFGNVVYDIKETIHSNWEKVSQKDVSGLIYPNDSWMANSEGGFWNFQTVQNEEALIEDSPNTLNLKAHYINVDVYGSRKDLAYVVYLSENIE